MAIKTGRYGKVSWDPAGGSALVQIVSINAWTGSFKNDYEDVTCFGDANKVYIPGLMNIEGTFSGFWNSAELALFRAAMSPTPGTLQLMPNTTEPTFFWQGPAYMGADIDASLEAPKVTGEFKAAGDWMVPGEVLATGAGPGTGNGTFTPTGATPPQNFAALTGVTANPATAWTSGQRILLADGTSAHWNGTAWVVGPKPQMFQGPVTLRGQEATVVWFYQTAAVCRSWTARRTPQGQWTLRADVTRADPFRLRQQQLLFRAPRKGGYFVWPVIGASLTDTHLVATLGPPIS